MLFFQIQRLYRYTEGGNGNGKKKGGLKPGQDDAVDKAVDDEVRKALIAGGSLAVPSVQNTMLVQVFTVRSCTS
jgi:hypothetical protein